MSLRTTLGRVTGAWRALAGEQRLAVIAAAGLFVTMFLPWYSVTNGRTGTTRVLTAFGDFSFVEVAVLLVALSVAFLLFARAERRAFHLPGGDGTIVMLAGGWAAFLLFYRLIDKPGEAGGVVVGVRWGIFVALVAAGLLTYAGYRIRSAHRPEPPLPAERPRERPTEPVVADAPSPPRPRPRRGDEPTVALPGRRPGPRVPRPDDPPDPPSTLF